MSITAFTLLDGQNQPVIGASVAITAEVGMGETVTLTARDALTGQTVAVSWPFEAIAAPPQRTYLPMVRR